MVDNPNKFTYAINDVLADSLMFNYRFPDSTLLGLVLKKNFGDARVVAFMSIVYLP